MLFHWVVIKLQWLILLQFFFCMILAGFVYQFQLFMQGSVHCFWLLYFFLDSNLAFLYTENDGTHLLVHQFIVEKHITPAYNKKMYLSIVSVQLEEWPRDTVTPFFTGHHAFMGTNS